MEYRASRSGNPNGTLVIQKGKSRPRGKKNTKANRALCNRLNGANRATRKTVPEAMTRCSACMATGEAVTRVRGMSSRYHRAGWPSYFRFASRSAGSAQASMPNLALAWRALRTRGAGVAAGTKRGRRRLRAKAVILAAARSHRRTARERTAEGSEEPNHAPLQYHRPGQTRQALLHPAALPSGPGRGPPAGTWREVLRAARAAPDRQDLRPPGAARPAQRTGLRLRVHHRRDRAHRPRRRGAGDADGACRIGLTGALDTGGRASGEGLVRRSGRIRPERGVARGAETLGGRRHRSRWCCSSTRSTPSRATPCSRRFSSYARATPCARRAFPQCVVLCGLRDVRDYRIRSTSSPFNIVAKSLRLGDFTQEETLALLDQHTEEAGQAFTPEAREAIWTQTLGQPWLVNALAYETCFEHKAGRDRSRAITADDVAEAREGLIVRRVTHLDQLADKLREDRVRRVIEPMLSGADERRATGQDIELRARPRADCPGQAGAHRQPHLRGGGAARAGLDRAGGAGPGHEMVRGRGRRPGRGQAPGVVPGLLPPPFGALEEPVRLRGAVAADPVAGVPAPGGERGRSYRAGVRVGPGAGWTCC